MFATRKSSFGQLFVMMQFNWCFFDFFNGLFHWFRNNISFCFGCSDKIFGFWLQTKCDKANEVNKNEIFVYRANENKTELIRKDKNDYEIGSCVHWIVSKTCESIQRPQFYQLRLLSYSHSFKFHYFHLHSQLLEYHRLQSQLNQIFVNG